MRRTLIIVLSLFFTLSLGARPRSLGLRAGLEYQLSYQHGLSGPRADFLELGLGYQLLGKGVNVAVAVAYNFMLIRPDWTQKGEWGFYAGPAMKTGFMGVGCYIAAGVQVGLEYAFEFPLQISLDVRPALGMALVNMSASLYGGETTIGAIPCLSVRYRFGR